MMKRTALIFAIGTAALASGIGAASAQVVELGVAPGPYVAVAPPAPYYRHYRRHYAYVPGCHVVVREHWNRWGQRVIRRMQVCD